MQKRNIELQKKVQNKQRLLYTSLINSNKKEIKQEGNKRGHRDREGNLLLLP